MPHHSSHGPAGHTSEMQPIHSLYSPQGMSGEAMRGHTVAHIMRPQHGPYSSPPCYHHTGMVTPMKQNSWIHGAPMSRAMPTLETPKSADSLDRSTATKRDDSTVTTLAAESDDDLEKREATASALLMVSKCSKADSSAPSSSSPTARSTTSKVPLKKRKNLNFLRPKTEAAVTSSHDPCHVSPVSHSSLESSSRTISKEEGSPERCPTSAVRSESYDSKESPVGNLASAQALLETSKINNTIEIAPQSQASIPHFPTVLHQVLADESCAGNVVQWTEDGEAWKVLRWDALRRQVLPKYFANLTDEHGKGSGTIDAFLWHLTAWGFEEKQDGSYRHEFFIRGAQKLASKMRSNGIPNVIQETKGSVSPKAISPLRNDPRSMLEVPSLSASRPELENTMASYSNKRARYPLGGWVQRPQETVDASGWGRFYSEAQQVGMRHTSGTYITNAYDPRFPMTAHPATPYSPHPQVTRSGRGRMGMNRPSASPTPCTPVSRAAFPVSNRGKGSRKNNVCRASLPSPVTVPAGRASPAISYGQRGVQSTNPAEPVVRKNKRKLPIAQNAVTK